MLYLPIRLRSAVSSEDEPLGTGREGNIVMETPLIILRTEATRSTDSDSSLFSLTEDDSQEHSLVPQNLDSYRSDLAGEPRLLGTFQNIPFSFKQRG